MNIPEEDYLAEAPDLGAHEYDVDYWVPHISIDCNQLDFSEIPVGALDSLAFNVTNTGPVLLEVQPLMIDPDLGIFTLIVDDEFSLVQDSTHQIWVYFTPTEGIPYQGNLIISSNDLENPEISIPLSGSGANQIKDTDLLPASFSLSSPFPNPFNSTTTIGYSLPAAGVVSLAVYDLSGREVARLVDGMKSAGTHEAVWVADGVASGVYVVKLVAGEKAAREKVVLVK